MERKCCPKRQIYVTERERERLLVADYRPSRMAQSSGEETKAHCLGPTHANNSLIDKHPQPKGCWESTAMVALLVTLLL